MTIKTKAIVLSGLTILVAVLGVSLSTYLLALENLSPHVSHYFGVPVGSFIILTLLSSVLAAIVIALIWIDYRQHLEDERAQRRLEETVAQRTEQLSRANEQLQAVDRMKTELIHRVSHELRTPLTSITGYTEVLLQGKPGPLSELQEEFLRTISDNATRLRGMVDDVLEISRWEAGTQRIRWLPIVLPEIIRESMDALRPMLTPKNLVCVLEVRKAVPPVHGDAGKLLQMINNLVGNAIKYTPDGGRILIAVSATERHVRLTISDTGIGIPPEFQSRLFEKFERASNVEQPGYRGTGLGLYLVKQIVDAHGGVIHVESQLGHGTAVTVLLPAAHPDHLETTTEPARSSISIGPATE